MEMALTLEDFVPYRPITLESVLRRIIPRYENYDGLNLRQKLTPIDEKLLQILEQKVLPDVRHIYPNLLKYNQTLTASIPVDVPNEKQVSAFKDWLGYFFPDFGLPQNGDIDIFCPVRQIGSFISRQAAIGQVPKEISPKVKEMLISAAETISQQGVKVDGLYSLCENPEMVVHVYQRVHVLRQDFDVKFGGLIQRLGYQPHINPFLDTQRRKII